ncbi:hypothetical protein ACNOYE_26820 [Nannocystaceae bacterium ST9]
MTFDAAGRVRELAGPYWDSLNPPSPNVELTYRLQWLSETWSGETQGTVTRVTSQSINAGDDGLPLTGGGVTLSRGEPVRHVPLVHVHVARRRGAWGRSIAPWARCNCCTVEEREFLHDPYLSSLGVLDASGHGLWTTGGSV